MSDNQDALLCADALERRGYASLTMQTRLADHEIAAHIRRLHAENEALKTVMIAAAEEISEHWEAHCDSEGYGPANLMRRLENGIPSQYGYTAGAFAQLKAELAEQARLNGMGSEREARLETENDQLRHAMDGLTQRCITDTALIGELVSALNAMLTHMGMDEDESNKGTFKQARAALAKAGVSK